MAWQAIYLIEAVAELGAGYDCANCEREEKDLPKGCPRCALIETQNNFHEDVIEVVEKRFKKFPDGWELARLLDLHAYVVRILRENDNRVSLNWDVTTAELARLILAERAKKEFIDYTELKAKTRR